MADLYVLDTHALIWYLEGNRNLGSLAEKALQDPDAELILPAIALAEACWIVESGRTGLPSARQLLEDIRSEARLSIYPLTDQIVIRTLSLANIREMHDRQIVATALHLQSSGYPIALLTRDENITAAGVVPVLW